MTATPRPRRHERQTLRAGHTRRGAARLAGETDTGHAQAWGVRQGPEAPGHSAQHRRESESKRRDTMHTERLAPQGIGNTKPLFRPAAATARLHRRPAAAARG